MTIRAVFTAEKHLSVFLARVTVVCLPYTSLEFCALLIWTATPMLNNSATDRRPTATASAVTTPAGRNNPEQENVKVGRLVGLLKIPYRTM